MVSDQITVLRGSWCVICEMEAATTSILQHRASTCPLLQDGYSALIRTGPPTTHSIGRLQVGPEKAGSATSFPAAPSGPLDLGWFLLGTEAPV